MFTNKENAGNRAQGAGASADERVGGMIAKPAMHIAPKPTFEPVDLVLNRAFSRAPQLDFGKLSVGGERTLLLRLCNEALVPMEVALENRDALGDFAVGSDTTLALPPNTQTEVAVTWTPQSAGRVFQTLKLHVNKRIHLACVLLGECTAPKGAAAAAAAAAAAKKPTATAAAAPSAPATALKPRAVPMATRKLQLPHKIGGAGAASTSMSMSANTSTASSAVAAASGAPASRQRQLIQGTSECYDNHWMDKQDRAFAAWLNHMLVNRDAALLAADKGAAGAAAAASASHVPAYGRRRVLQLRMSARAIMEGDECMSVFRTLHREIFEKQTLAVRDDIDVSDDVGVRQQMLDLLMQFHPAYLRLGLETTCGEVMNVASRDHLPAAIADFYVTRVASDDETRRRHQLAARTTTAFDDGLQPELRQHFVLRMLQLFMFLDRAATSKLLPVCLLEKEASVKSTNAALSAFAVHFLRGEANVVRHLGFLGYRLQYEQTPLDEYAWPVNNLATDLRDGVRLARLADLLTAGDASVCKQLRFPADSPVQRMHNVAQALVAFAARGVQMTGPHGEVTAKDVVAGHRPRTLWLIWQLVVTFRLPALLDVERVQRETALVAARCPRQRRRSVHMALQRFKEHREQLYFRSTELSALLEWVVTVCGQYDLPVSNFTSSFADGRVLCLLLHHYAPWLLPLDTIRSLPKTGALGASAGGADDASAAAGAGAGADEGDSEDDMLASGTWSKTFDFSRTDEPASIDAQRANMRTAARVIHELGGLPAMVREEDFVNAIPDEKLVITFVSHLFTRLVEVRDEAKAIERAAVCVQRTVRQWLARRRSTDAAYARRQQVRGAALVLQQHWRTRKQTKQARTEFKALQHAVQLLQPVWRSALLTRRQRAQFLEMRAAAEKIQAAFRGHAATGAERSKYTSKRAAAIVLQRAYRSLMLMRSLRTVFLAKRDAAVKIQGAFRGFLASKEAASRLRAVRAAVLTIQAAWLAELATRRATAKFQQLRSAAMSLQRRWRANQAGAEQSASYQQARQRIVSLQRHWRAVLSGREVRGRLAQQRLAAVLVQSVFRGHVLRNELQSQFRAARHAAVAIQRALRGHRATQRARADFLELRSAVLAVQLRFRARVAGNAQRAAFVQQRTAATRIAQVFRGHQATKLARGQFVQARAAATTLQRVWRARVAGGARRDAFVLQRRAAVALQRRWRARSLGFAQRLAFLSARLAATVFQDRFRALLAGRAVRAQLALQRRAATRIAQSFRGMLATRAARASFARVRAAAVAVQRAFRGLEATRAARAAFVQQRAACRIQAAFRGLLATRAARAAFVQKRTAAVALQRAFRGHVATCAAMAHAIRVRLAVLSIQRAWFGLQAARKARALVQQLRGAAVVMQRRWRARVTAAVQRAAFVALRGAALVLQQRWRALLSGRAVRARMSQERAAACAIQRAFRGHALRQRERAAFVALRGAALVAQRCARRVLAGRRANELRDELARAQAQRRAAAALLIQRVFRGFRVRKEDSARRREMRERVQRANAEAKPHMTLGSRTRSALDVLLKEKSLTRLITACQSLEVTTRHSIECCVNVVRKERAVSVMLDLIKTCNRSKPHMLVLQHTLHVLINMSTCAETREAVFAAPQVFEVLINTMQLFARDQPTLAMLAAQVMFNTLHDERHVAVVRAQTKQTARLSAVHALLRKLANAPAGAGASAHTAHARQVAREERDAFLAVSALVVRLGLAAV